MQKTTSKTTMRKLIKEIQIIAYNELHGNPVYSNPKYALINIQNKIMKSGFGFSLEEMEPQREDFVKDDPDRNDHITGTGTSVQEMETWADLDFIREEMKGDI